MGKVITILNLRRLESDQINFKFSVFILERVTTSCDQQPLFPYGFPLYPPTAISHNFPYFPLQNTISPY